MNEIDKKFYELIKTIRNLTEDELFQRMKLNYLSLPKIYKDILEDYFTRFDFWGTLNSSQGDFNEIQQKAKLLSRKTKDFVWLYNKLEDYSSKLLLFAIINNFFIYDFSTLKNCIDKKYRHYCDFDLIPSLKNKVLVDVGAYVGDTVLDFISCYGECYKNIYCYEITEKMMDIMKNNLHRYKNIKFFNYAVKDKKGVVYVNERGDISSNQTACKGENSIDCVTLDENIKEKIDLIKMDIEGDELNALKGAKQHIKKDCPILLISLYHKNEHYIQIPKYIYSLNKNYKFYLRYYGGELYPTEVVLFALPKN